MTSLLQIARSVHVAALSDAMDDLDERNQVIEGRFTRYGKRTAVAGWAFTIQGARSSLTDTSERIGPRVIDEMSPDDLACYSTGGVMDVGIWGELWTAGSIARGCVGAVIDGPVRDSSRIVDQDTAIYALGACPRDAVGRFTVVDRQVPIVLGGVRIEPKDLVVADSDGAIAIPRALVEQALSLAADRVGMERSMRDALAEGTSASKAYDSAGYF